jgi:hypothetical protein
VTLFSIFYSLRVALFLLFLLQAGLLHEARAQDTTLPESGIRYPGGFDSNTVGEIKGTAFGFSFPERGPVSFKVSVLSETYTILVSPLSTWSNDIKYALKEGAEVRVLGSKTLGPDGRLYMIAQDVETTQARKKMSFRSGEGFPLWERPVVKRNTDSGPSFRRSFEGSGGAFSNGGKGSAGGRKGGGGGGGGGGR